LFADIVGFSTVAEYLDPEDLRTELEETFARLAAVVEERDGVVEKFIGDAIVAIFGAPVAHEDDPRRAVESAVGMQQAIAARNNASQTPFKLRIGINNGLVVAGSLRDGAKTGVIGDAVNVAARLQQGANPGQILVADTIMRRIHNEFETVPVGTLAVKGRDQSVNAHKVVGRRPAPLRHESPFVGRHEELALLDLLWSSASKGNTHVISLIGDAGVGKSRLLAEFATLDDGIDVRVSCSPEHAYGPFLEIIGKLLGDLPKDLADLKTRVSALKIDHDEATSLLAAFLGLKGAPPVVRMADAQQKRQVFAGIWRFLLGVAAVRPLFVELDDAHWADRSSLDLLGFLLERLTSTPIMLVLAYRPGFDQIESMPTRASHTAVRLELLGDEESCALARGYLQVKTLPAELEKVIISRAEGNAFFIEELLRALLDLGSLTIEDDRAVLSTVDVSIPDTVEGTILARVDRLKSSDRTVLQHAAVIGRTFTTALVESLLEIDVDRSLQSLSRAQLIVPQGEGGRWIFKHALIQEVVYDTLLIRRRKELHRAVAEALEQSAGSDPELLEKLAEHYSQAQVPVKARSYALAAGNLARDRLGYAEATLRYQTALRLWGDGDEVGRFDLLDKLGATAQLGSDPSTAKSALTEAVAGWKARGDSDRAGTSLALLGRALWSAGESDRAADALEEAISLLRPSGPSLGLVQVHVWRSSLLMLDGQTLEAIEVARRGLQIEAAVGHLGFRSQLLNTLGVCASDLGDPTGVDQLRQALDLAESSGDADAIARAYVNLPSTLDDLFEREEAVELCRRGRERAQRLGSPAYESFIAGNEARSLLGLGRHVEAEELARKSLVFERSISGAPGIVGTGNVLGVVLYRTGRYTEARRVYDEILPHGRRVGGTEFLARLLIDIAQLHETLGNSIVARTHANEALALLANASSLFHVVLLLPAIAQLLPDEAPNLIARCKPAARHNSWRACLGEAEGWIGHDVRTFHEAADIYERLHSPYDEARCRLQAGDIDRGAQLVETYGLQEGPLGRKLQTLVAAQLE
jgi:adenylate cyclase